MTNQEQRAFGLALANADDMTKHWPKVKLLFFLGFPTAARNNLCHWHWGKQDDVTLAEVFELVISSERDPRAGYLISRMLDVRCVGKTAFLRVVRYMAGLDFGKQCNLAWKIKYSHFLNASRAKGSNVYCWSFPITEEGKLLAKTRNGKQHLPRRRRPSAI